MKPSFKEFLKNLSENVLSMKDHVSNKIKEKDKEINDMLDKANTDVDKGFIRDSKKTTKDAWVKYLENKKAKKLEKILTKS